MHGCKRKINWLSILFLLNENLSCLNVNLLHATSRPSKGYTGRCSSIFPSPLFPFSALFLMCVSLPLNHIDSSMMSGCRNLLCNLCVWVCTCMHMFCSHANCPHRLPFACVFPCIVCMCVGEKSEEVCFFFFFFWFLLLHTCFLTFHLS